MNWIQSNPRLWRSGILILGVLSLLGAWAFDTINVPAEYACSEPFVRMYGDFCGIPLMGIQLALWGLGIILTMLPDLMNGLYSLETWWRQMLYSGAVLVILLPMAVSFLMLRRSSVRAQLFAIFAWGAGAGLGILYLNASRPDVPFVYWGVWLYLITALAAITLEVLNLRAARLDGGLPAPA